MTPETRDMLRRQAAIAQLMEIPLTVEPAVLLELLAELERKEKEEVKCLR